LTAAFTSDEDPGNPDDCSDGYVNVGQGGYDHTYGYNAIGNLTSVDGANWTYGAGSAGPHALTSAPGASFSYDNTGRQVSRTINTVTTTIGWTPTGMTDTLTTGSDVTTYLYTADGEQVARQDPDTTITLRVADLWETDGTTTKQYLSFAGVPVAVDVETTGTERTWLISDLLGSNSVLHNTTSGNVRVWYDPWGVERAATGTPATPYGYTGQHTEPTGLIDYNARQYDPTYKTFTAADPIIPNPNNPQTLNRYAYVNNNPTTYTDPTGHVAEHGGGSGCHAWIRCAHQSPSGTRWKYHGTHGSTRPLGVQPYYGPTVHDLLDPLGMVPVVGEPFDLLSAVIYAFEKDWVNAGLSSVAIIPIFGWSANLARYGDDAADIIKGGTRGLGMLENASTAAFRAADNVDDFSVAAKHQPWAGGNYSKFDWGLDQQAVIREALTSDSASFLPNYIGAALSEDSFRVVVDLGRTIGTRGETAIRIVLGTDGRIWTAFPVKS